MTVEFWNKLVLEKILDRNSLSVILYSLIYNFLGHTIAPRDWKPTVSWLLSSLNSTSHEMPNPFCETMKDLRFFLNGHCTLSVLLDKSFYSPIINKWYDLASQQICKLSYKNASWMQIPQLFPSIQ